MVLMDRTVGVRAEQICLSRGSGSAFRSSTWVFIRGEVPGANFWKHFEGNAGSRSQKKAPLVKSVEVARWQG